MLDHWEWLIKMVQKSAPHCMFGNHVNSVPFMVPHVTQSAFRDGTVTFALELCP